VKRHDLLHFLDGLLKPALFKDYAPNGLQVEGREEILKIVCGVTACQALIDRAIELGADTILVHHGYFWKDEDPRVIGMKATRLKSLLTHDINLIGYHLPLDAHRTLGNNMQLTQLLGCKLANPLPEDNTDIVFETTLAKPMTGEDLAEHLSNTLSRKPLHIPADSMIQRVAICSGGAQDYIDQAIALGVDAFITGEVSEKTVHIAREANIHFYAAGHHATERYGIKALGEHIQSTLGIECEFVDIDNPA
jgi:dinuclear metal center YbgI/SA1388 family protein